MRKDNPIIVNIYLILLLLMNFVIQYLYVFADDYQTEKFYLSALIICSMITIVYTIWFFDLLRKKEDEDENERRKVKYPPLYKAYKRSRRNENERQNGKM